MQMEERALACHAERQRSISRVGPRDASLTLSMTLGADSSFFARCAECAICWNQWAPLHFLEVSRERCSCAPRGRQAISRTVTNPKNWFTLDLVTGQLWD